MSMKESLKRVDRIIKVKPGPDGTPPSRWINHDLAPVPLARRTWTTVDIFAYWISDQFATATWSLGASIISLGLTAREGIPLTFAAFTVIGIILTLNGRIGSMTHLPFPVLARVSFGMYGAYLAILIRSILALLWLCILTYQAGNITAVMLTAIWPSYGRIENKLPEGLGITSQTLLGFAIFWMIQTPLSVIPVHKLRYFFWFKAVICPIAFFALFVWGLVVTKGHAPYIDGPMQVQGSKAWAIISALNICTGLYSTMSINIADFSRFAKNNAVNWTQLIAVPVSGTIPVICSIIATAAGQKIWGIAAWDPATLIALFDNRACQFFSAFAFLVATIGSNISANSISFATDVTSVFPRYLTIFRASILAAVLCFAVNPWKIVTSAPSFVNFLGAYPVFLAPVAIIMTVDFYVVRRGKIDVREIYDPKGIYAYRFGINWRAILAWVITLAPNLPAFAHAIDPVSNPDLQPYTYRFSWYFSTIVGGLTYYIINLISPPKRSFVPEAVYDIPLTEGLVEVEEGEDDPKSLKQAEARSVREVSA